MNFSRNFAIKFAGCRLIESLCDSVCSVFFCGNCVVVTVQFLYRSHRGVSMYIETNKVEKMVSFLDVGLVSPFGRRRTVTEAGFVSIIEDILLLTTPGIVDREQEQRKKRKRRRRSGRRTGYEKRKKRLAAFRLEPIPPSPSSRVFISIYYERAHILLFRVFPFSLLAQYFFSSRDGQKGFLSSRF